MRRMRFRAMARRLSFFGQYRIDSSFIVPRSSLVDMTDDALLITAFAESKSPDVFAHLVGRHVHLVYSSCLRQLRNPVLADQATSAVFVLLARQAVRLKGSVSLVPWLFDTARRVCRGAAKLAPA